MKITAWLTSPRKVPKKNQADEPRTSTRGKSNNFDFEPVSNLIQDNKSREFRLSAFIMEAMII
jgi:hypothetical protein